MVKHYCPTCQEKVKLKDLSNHLNNHKVQQSLKIYSRVSKNISISPSINGNTAMGQQILQNLQNTGTMFENVSTETETYEDEPMDYDYEQENVAFVEESQGLLADEEFQDQNMDPEEECLTQEKKDVMKKLEIFKKTVQTPICIDTQGCTRPLDLTEKASLKIRDIMTKRAVSKTASEELIAAFNEYMSDLELGKLINVISK